MIEWLDKCDNDTQFMLRLHTTVHGSPSMSLDEQERKSPQRMCECIGVLGSAFTTIPTTRASLIHLSFPSLLRPSPIHIRAPKINPLPIIPRPPRVRPIQLVYSSVPHWRPHLKLPPISIQLSGYFPPALLHQERLRKCVPRVVRFLLT